MAVVDLNLAAAEQTVAELPTVDGQHHLALSANVAQEMDLRRIIVTVESHPSLGPIWLWCGNAGIPSNGGIDVPSAPHPWNLQLAGCRF